MLGRRGERIKGGRRVAARRGKAGSDFDPKGRSDREVMRFCQSFTTELYRHLGEDTDIPAGDIGVGTREIGFLFGQYKRITNRYESGTLTGKGVGWGGAPVRTEATGYVVDEKGLDVEVLRQVKEQDHRCLDAYAEARPDATFVPGRSMWEVPCEVALPSATQNELGAEAAAAMVRHGCIAVGEGANMPTTPDAVRLFLEAGVAFGPGKAANAGGVAASALEMQQNAARDSGTFADSERRLEQIIAGIHDRCLCTADDCGAPGNYLIDANVAAFTRVADAMLALGMA